MSEFSIWHVLPPGTMPTVRQVLEFGGGRWFEIETGLLADVSIRDGRACWWLDGQADWRSIVPLHLQLGVTNPRPIEAPMPTAAEVGTESRWVVLCLFGLRSADREFSRDACTLRAVGGLVEVLFDGDDQWVPLASQWGAGMVALKDSAQAGG